MALDNFETEGHRTYTPEGERATKQDTFGTRVVDNFEDDWGLPQHKAEKDLEFIAERFKEAESAREMCKIFDCLEHFVVEKAAKCVDEGLLEADDIPSLNHTDYNDKPISFYIEQYNKSASVTSNTPASQQTSTSSNSEVDEEEEDFSSGLGNFVS